MCGWGDTTRWRYWATSNYYGWAEALDESDPSLESLLIEDLSDVDNMDTDDMA